MPALLAVGSLDGAHDSGEQGSLLHCFTCRVTVTHCLPEVGLDKREMSQMTLGDFWETHNVFSVSDEALREMEKTGLANSISNPETIVVVFESRLSLMGDHSR